MNSFVSDQNQGVADVIIGCSPYQSQVKRFFEISNEEKIKTTSTENNSGYTSSASKQQFQARINKTTFYNEEMRREALAASSLCFSFCMNYLSDWFKSNCGQMGDICSTNLDHILDDMSEEYSVLLATEYNHREDTSEFCPPHLDSGLLTLCISPDDGLQLFDNEKKEWFRAHGANKVVVIFGESLQEITGGTARAQLHRVVKTPTNRFSLVYKLRLNPTISGPRSDADYRIIMQKQKLQSSYMKYSDLPTDVLNMIMRYLPNKDLCACESVSKYWNTVASSEYVWKLLFVNHFGPTDLKVTSWKRLFIQRTSNKPKDKLLMSFNKSFSKNLKDKTLSAKLVMVGDDAVGKTCILITHCSKHFPIEYIPTVFDEYTMSVDIEGSNVMFSYWDCAGHSDYDLLRPLSYPATDILVIVYTVDRRDSFNHVKSKWISEVKVHLPNVPVILVGSKIDQRLTINDCVTFDEGLLMAEEIGAIGYFEVSSLKVAGLKELFDTALIAALHHSLKIPFDQRDVQNKKKKCSVQ